VTVTVEQSTFGDDIDSGAQQEAHGSSLPERFKRDHEVIVAKLRPRHSGRTSRQRRRKLLPQMLSEVYRPVYQGVYCGVCHGPEAA
jgi:hypothetical protein